MSARDHMATISLPPMLGAPGAGRSTLAARLARITLAQILPPQRPRLLLVVDWRSGLNETIARQVALAVPLLNPLVVVAINHLDRAGFEYEAFKSARKQALDLLSALNVPVGAVVPISARLGEGIERNTDRTEWYVGPTLIELLSRDTPSANVIGFHRFAIAA